MNSSFPDASFCPLIYGPVLSRRHGRSLGINLGIPNQKVCTWGCIYCQCGMGERREIKPSERNVSAREIVSLIGITLKEDPKIDSITFAGNSEPTAHPDFFEIIQGILSLRKELQGEWIINCLTNGSELDRSQVIEACALLDDIWVKLDCGIDDLFQRFNRPLSRIGGLRGHVGRIKKLKDISIQTLVWRSDESPKLSNWTNENKRALLKLYSDLKPRKIHLTTIARDPAVSKLKAVPKTELLEFADQVKKLGLALEVFE